MTPPYDDSACESGPSSRLNVATTSATVIGLPSWKRTPRPNLEGPGSSSTTGLPRGRQAGPQDGVLVGERELLAGDLGDADGG